MHPEHDPLTPSSGDDDDERTLELREEQLVAKKEQRTIGEIVVRTEIDEVPAQLEVEAVREEVIVEHEPVGEAVSERQQPWEQDGVLIVPVYEEQLVVTKRLVLRERIHVRSVSTRARQLFQDTVKRDRLVVEDPQHTGSVREQYPTDTRPENADAKREPADERDEGNVLTRLVSKALE